MKLLQRSLLASSLWVLSVVAAAGPLDVDVLPAWFDRVSAQEAQEKEEDPAESRSAAFQAVEGPQAEQVPGGPLLIAAYAVVLVLLCAYVARLGALYAKNRAELDRLGRVLYIPGILLIGFALGFVYGAKAARAELARKEKARKR